MDAVTSTAEPVDEEPEEASRRLRRTMSWSVSDGVEEDAGRLECRWKRSASGLASSRDSQTLGDLTKSSNHRRCHDATYSSQHKESDSPP